MKVKIPAKISDTIWYKSEGRCYCGKRADQIHHLDENPANNDFDNLIFLCYDHHDDASVKKGLKRRPSIKQLKQFRDRLYRDNDKKREVELKQYRTTLKNITGEDLYRASLDATIVHELIKINEEYYTEKTWEKRTYILEKINRYIDHSSLRVSSEVMNILYRKSHARSEMPYNMSSTISNLIMNFFPYPKNPKETNTAIKIAEICGYTAHAIAYDAFLYLGNLAVASSGLEILKFMYRRGEEFKIPAFSKIALEQHTTLKNNLIRPERKDLETAKLFLRIFKDDLETHSFHLPGNMSPELFDLMQSHMKESRQIKWDK